MRSLRLSPTSSNRRVLVLEFIRRYFREHGASPGYREIHAQLGIPIQRIREILVAWQAAGVLTFERGRPHSILLVDRAANLSDSELELACHARGWQVRKSTAPGLVEAIPAVPIAEGVTEYGLDLLRQLNDIP